VIEAASLPGIAGAKSSSIRVIWYIRAIRDRSPEAMRWMHSQETSRISQIAQISRMKTKENYGTASLDYNSCSIRVSRYIREIRDYAVRTRGV